jgi:AraC-like DNA-binding protein
LGHGILEVCAMAETLLAARGLTGCADATPLAVGFPAVSDELASLTTFFGLSPALGVPRAFVCLPEQLAIRRLPHANALFLQIFERKAGEELSRLPPHDDFDAKLRAEITRQLARGKLALKDCADSLGMSARTLERRLSDRGTRYQELLDSVRKASALRWLKEGRAVEEVAVLLGYSERSSFHRACVRWFRKTPVELRQSLPAAARRPEIAAPLDAPEDDR